MTKEEFILYVYFFSVNHLLRHDFRRPPPFEFAICLNTLSESGFSGFKDFQEYSRTLPCCLIRSARDELDYPVHPLIL